MYTNKDLIEAINSQIDILKHLWSKVSDDNKDFKLSENTRSIEELMFYISYSLPKQVQIFSDWTMTNESFADSAEKQIAFSYKNFATDLDNAMINISNIIANQTEGQMEEIIEVFGMKTARKNLFINYINQFLGAYKTQLFLQVKTSWLSELNTMNLRAGVDKWIA